MIDATAVIVQTLKEGALTVNGVRRVWTDSQVDKPNVIRLLLTDGRTVALVIETVDPAPEGPVG